MAAAEERPNLSALTLQTAPPRRDAFADADAAIARAQRRRLNKYRRSQGLDPVTPLSLETLDDDVLLQVLSFPRGMPCEAITALCSASKSFQVFCNAPGFWRWQCEMRSYDRPSRLAFFSLTTSTTLAAGQPPNWKAVYEFWCASQFKSTQQLRDAVANAADYNNYWDDVHGSIVDWDVSMVTDMSFLFLLRDGTAGNQIVFDGDISLWDVSQVTDMQGMFSFQRYFRRDLSGWDTSRVTNMSGMFYGCNAFNSDLSQWDVSRVRDMEKMFAAAYVFDQDLSRWKVGTVESMAEMFSNAAAFKGDGLAGWDVGNVKNMHSMFEQAVAFNANLSRWEVGKVESTSFMFLEATLFKGDGLAGWDVSSVANFLGMFMNATTFNADLSLWDTSGCQQPICIAQMFQGADSYAPKEGYEMGAQRPSPMLEW